MTREVDVLRVFFRDAAIEESDEVERGQVIGFFIMQVSRLDGQNPWWPNCFRR